MILKTIQNILAVIGTTIFTLLVLLMVAFGAIAVLAVQLIVRL